MKTIRRKEVQLEWFISYRSGLKTVPNNAKIHYNYANVLKEEGRLSEATKHYKEALRSVIHLGVYLLWSFVIYV